jgi:hypothetical protein
LFYITQCWEKVLQKIYTQVRRDNRYKQIE